jgi:hypothetical protein
MIDMIIDKSLAKFDTFLIIIEYYQDPWMRLFAWHWKNAIKSATEVQSTNFDRDIGDEHADTSNVKNI